MSRNPQTILREKFHSIERKWSGLKFLEYVGISGSIVCLAFFAIEESAEREYLTDQPLFFTLLFLLGILAVSALPGVLIIVSLLLPNRNWIAKQIETGCPGLLDRVNTLVHLETKYTAPGFKRRIEAQAAIVIAKDSVRSTIKPTLALASLTLFALMLFGVIWYDLNYQPFAKLLIATSVKSGGLTPQQDNPLELAPSKPTPPPAPVTWGEVRIVDPGHDLRLTKIDVVQLQIEMATSAPLVNPEWVTSVNGGPELSHPLPAPTEPQYAVYQPLFYLDELDVQDWDLVTYYARVKTNASNTYQSKIFTIEIKPFQEDFLKALGDQKGGKNRKMFDELNELIRKQTELMQQTYQFPDQNYPTSAMRDQDAVKLTSNQADIALSTHHFYGEVSAADSDKPIAHLLDSVSQAATAMTKSTDDLREQVIPQAEVDQRKALAALIAARKNFLMTLGSGDASGSQDETHDPDSPKAADTAKALSQVSEMKDQEAAAMDQLAHLKARQEQLAATRGSTAQSEENLKNQVNQLVANNEDLFRQSQDAASKFNQDADRAKKELEDGVSRENAHHFLDQAAGDLSQLQKNAQANHRMDQMAQAYQLKKILDQNAKQLAQEQQTPGSLSPGDKQSVNDTASNAAAALKQIADQPDSGFGQELSQSLSADKQAALQKALSQLKDAQPGPESQKAAGDAKDQIGHIGQAFDKSVPSLNQGQKGQNQGGGQGDQTGQGGSPGDSSDADEKEMDQLTEIQKQIQSLMLQKEDSSDPQKAGEKKEELDGVLDSLGQLEKEEKKPEIPDAGILAQVDQVKKDEKETPFPAEDLKKLLDAVVAKSGSIAEAKADKPPENPITLIDDSKLPPNYRNRIHNYYQQLSNAPR